MTHQVALLNGEFVDAAQPALWINDRGFQYGDGLFETMRMESGKVRLLDGHWRRLSASCARLKLSVPDERQWHDELLKVAQGRSEGIIKFTLTRGRGERGYRPAQNEPTRLWQWFPLPAASAQMGIQVRWCETRLSRNTLLAGIKHCNRLEQVLAQSEWQDAGIAEGLMLDTEGELVGGTMSNVFLWMDSAWVTPDLSYSGVAGVMRDALLRLMTELGIPVELRAMHGDEVAQAEEMFVCNAVRGIQPVLQLAERQWPIGIAMRQLLDAWSRQP